MTLVGIAYLIFKSKVYGFIGLPYIRTHAPEVMSFSKAFGRRLGIVDESTFLDMFS